MKLSKELKAKLKYNLLKIYLIAPSFYLLSKKDKSLTIENYMMELFYQLGTKEYLTAAEINLIFSYLGEKGLKNWLKQYFVNSNFL